VEDHDMTAHRLARALVYLDPLAEVLETWPSP
jgi:hypothetical protein